MHIVRVPFTKPNHIVSTKNVAGVALSPIPVEMFKNTSLSTNKQSPFHNFRFMASFEVNDLVFAKIKGNRSWPAVITNKETAKQEKEFKFSVLFFGDHTTATVNVKNLTKTSDMQVNSFIAGVKKSSKMSSLDHKYLAALTEFKNEGKQFTYNCGRFIIKK